MPLPLPQVCCQFDFKRLAGGKVSCPWKIRPETITNSNVATKSVSLVPPVSVAVC